MSGPSVVIFGPLGFIGKEITSTFLGAFKSQQISSLALASRDPQSSKFQAARKRGAEIVPTSFDDKAALIKTLRGIDVVISCMGTQGDYKKNKHVLMEACVEAGVKVYVPSEFGTDHRHIKYENQMFANKQEHHAQAEKLGLKVIAIYTGLIMETTFTKWLGFDTKARTWQTVGTGDEPLAMTSQRDLGPLVLQAILLASNNRDAVPSNLRVFSENRSTKEYKTTFEAVSGEKLKLELTSVEEAELEYEKKKDSIPAHMLGPLIPLLTAQGSFNHKPGNGREIINPGQKYFKWKTIEEYAQEVRGLPWEEGSPW